MHCAPCWLACNRLEPHHTYIHTERDTRMKQRHQVIMDATTTTRNALKTDRRRWIKELYFFAFCFCSSQLYCCWSFLIVRREFLKRYFPFGIRYLLRVLFWTMLVIVFFSSCSVICIWFVQIWLLESLEQFILAVAFP